VRLDGDLADAEFTTDLLIQQAGNDQRHHLPFATGERRVIIPERAYLRFLTKYGCTALDGVPNGDQQNLVVKRLCQEFDSPRLHGLHGHRHIAVSGDEDDRHVDPIDDALLQIETIEVRKTNVQYQAAVETRTRGWARNS